MKFAWNSDNRDSISIEIKHDNDKKNNIYNDNGRSDSIGGRKCVQGVKEGLHE